NIIGEIKMELHYWEKQLILYTKGHYNRIDYNKDLKQFPSAYYELPLEHTNDYNTLGMVTRLYQKLIDNGRITFTLETFIDGIFKRANFNHGESSVNRDDILRHMLGNIQGMKVKDQDKEYIVLGDIDNKLDKEINKDIAREKSLL